MTEHWRTRHRPSLDRLEQLLVQHRGEHIDCDGCDLAAEVVAVHRLRAMLCDELERVEPEMRALRARVAALTGLRLAREDGEDGE